MSPPAARLFAVSDLHVSYPENRTLVANIHPESDRDWLLVAGDVAEHPEDIAWALGLLATRFERVVWAPGNHELWSPANEPGPRGVQRYEALVDLCRRLGVVTPEDPYPVWPGADGPVVVAPLFILYDYSFRAPGTASKRESLRAAHAAGVVCTDEVMLDPHPYESREAWCAARIAATTARLDAIEPTRTTILVNHYPLVRAPTDILRHPVFAQWCGTVATADWHRRYRAAAVVYGHLHIPRTTWHDGVPFEEVSIGYPREWRPRRRPPAPRVIGPAAAAAP